MMTYIHFPGQETPCHEMGGKARALAALTETGLAIPPWFVLTPAAFHASLNEALRHELISGDQKRVQSALDQIIPIAAVREEIATALKQLSPRGERVAVRSSALDEDGREHSFAGQLDSFLFVAPEEVAARMAAVWRSAFSERVLTYRREQGLEHFPTPPAVLVQRMIDAEVAGVAFSADPVSGRRGIAVVSGVYGLGTALVSGECDADTWHIDRHGVIVARTLADKTHAHRADPSGPEGVQTRSVAPELARRFSLGDDEVRAVAALARRTALHFHCPQDIEWALADGEFYLLQSRPITSLTLLPDPDGALNLWDNSNIAESYGGITTPLTFSFARHIYEEVYRQFCRIMAVPAGAIIANERVFPRMLGLIRGRVYYNLLNWYRLLALFPGFTTNRRFMEQMMGVKEGIPDQILNEAVANYQVGQIRDRFNLLRSLGGLVSNLCRMNRSNARFYDRLNRVLAPTDPPLAAQRADELVAHYRMLEGELLTRWDAPLVNDFFAMVFYGLLRKLATGWCGDSNETLQNDLLAGEGGMISAEPAKRVREMAEVVAGDADLTELLTTGSVPAMVSSLNDHPQFGPLYGAYLNKFGDRCLDELKLESATLHDEPLPLLRAVGAFAQRIRGGGSAPAVDEGALRQGAEERVRSALHGHPLRRFIFARVLAQARERVRDRENLRFERTRLFGRVRRIFIELGKRFQADGILDDSREIFWLEKDEIFGFVEGTTSTTDLRGLVALRRAEFGRWREVPPPADRFETCGMVHHAQSCTSTVAPKPAQDGESLQGIGCCPGVVRGRVRVIVDPRGATLQKGEILVAERTDPGWIMLFPACSALLVERGSLLSHSAIVAREMGIPAIVSLPGVTAWLQDGDRVEMDGASGVVRKIADTEDIDGE